MNYMKEINEIKKLCDKLKKGESKKRDRKIEIYSSGVKAKLVNTYYSLQMIKELYDKIDETSTSSDNIQVADKLYFYVDSFFTFLYSSLDIVSHILNNYYNLGYDEKIICFKQINNQLKKYNGNLKVISKIDSILRSNYFKNLYSYRNCSTHRRQISLIFKTRKTQITGGYSTDDFTEVKILICDNPLTTYPKTKQGRELIDYCSKIFEHFFKNIKTIIENL